jgi:hypothetical protein
MPRRILKAFRSLVDPLRSSRTAERWMRTLPPADPLALQKKIVDRLARFPIAADIRPGWVDALLKVDARVEPVIAQLTRQYTANYETSTDVEVRMWHAVFDLIKGFIGAYQEAVRAGDARDDDKRWRALLPWVLVRLAYYRGLDGKFRLFRYSHWIPKQWREFHELYEFARTRGWHREQLVFGAGTLSRPGICVEQEYLKTLLLMRLDSGNFTADQVEWVALQLEDWSASLALSSTEAGASFCVDLTGTQGLRRQNHSVGDGHVLFLDAKPVYTRVVERMHWLREHVEPVKPGELPAREQRLLLMRLAALFGPDTLAITPRAARVENDSEVRVVIGLQAVCGAIAEMENSRDASPEDAEIDRQVAEIAAAVADPDSLTARVAGLTWKMADSSATGCRLTASVKETSVRIGEVRIGELLAIKDGDAWSLGVVRRMQRAEGDGLSLGVEIVARRFIRVLLRVWSASGNAGTDEERSYYAIYLPPRPDNQRVLQRSLIAPDDRFVAGGMVELETGNARFLVRFTQAIERQSGWVWALFNAVRKLS